MIIGVLAGCRTEAFDVVLHVSVVEVRLRSIFSRLVHLTRKYNAVYMWHTGVQHIIVKI